MPALGLLVFNVPEGALLSLNKILQEEHHLLSVNTQTRWGERPQNKTHYTSSKQRKPKAVRKI